MLYDYDYDLVYSSSSPIDIEFIIKVILSVIVVILTFGLVFGLCIYFDEGLASLIKFIKYYFIGFGCMTLLGFLSFGVHKLIRFIWEF